MDSGEVPRSSAQVGDDAYLHQNIAFSGVFTPVLAKHSKSFPLIDCISVGVDRMQRNFEPMRRQVEAWQKSELTDVTQGEEAVQSIAQQFEELAQQSTEKWRLALAKDLNSVANTLGQQLRQELEPEAGQS